MPRKKEKEKEVKKKNEKNHSRNHQAPTPRGVSDPSKPKRKMKSKKFTTTTITPPTPGSLVENSHDSDDTLLYRVMQRKTKCHANTAFSCQKSTNCAKVIRYDITMSCLVERDLMETRL